MILTLLAIALSYLIGAIPAGHIAGKIRGINIKEHGSGNIGFTNVLRVMGMKSGAIVLLADVGKGAFAVLVISQLGAIESNIMTPYIRVLCGGFAMIGHVWTVFLKFRGGKGVATSLGIFIGLFWQAGLISLAVWLVTVAITRYVSLGSILLCISFCVACFIAGGQYIWGMRIMALIVTIIVIYRHRGNIQRLIRGEERKFGRREKSTA